MGYVFDPEALRDIARGAIDLPLESAFDKITDGLAERYPGHINTRPRDWIFNNAGGAMGQLTLLHCSLSEYVILFGSPIGTEGHSGRYSTHVYDTMIQGEMWCYHEGESEKTIYRPGDMAYLGPDRVKGYRLPDGAWMLEYARGNITSMLPFGLADTIFSTLDRRAVMRTITGYGRLVVKSLMSGKI